MPRAAGLIRRRLTLLHAVLTAAALCLVQAAPLIAQSRPQLFVQVSHSDGLMQMAISDDGRYGATVDVGGVLKIWNLLERLEVRRLKLGAVPRPVAFTADGRHLATAAGAGDDSRFEFIPLDDRPRPALKSPLANVSTFSFSPDGAWLACGDVFGGVALTRVDGQGTARDIIQRSPPKTKPFDVNRQAETAVTHLVFSSDSRLLAIGTAGGEVTVADVPSGRVLQGATRIEHALLTSLAINRRHHVLVGLIRAPREELFSGSGRLQLLDLTGGKMLFDAPTPHRGTVNVASDGTRAVTLLRSSDTWGTTDTTLQVLSIDGDLVTSEMTPWQNHDFEEPIAVQREGPTVLLREAASDQRLTLLDLNQHTTSPLDASPVRDITRISFIGNHLSLATDKFASAWNVDLGIPFHQYAYRGTPALNADGSALAAFRPDGHLWLTRSAAEGTPELRTPITGSLAVIEVIGRGSGVVVSSDHGHGGAASYWLEGMTQPRQLCASPPAFTARTRIAASQNGRFIAASCNENLKTTVHIVDVRHDRITRRIEKMGLTAIGFSDDGTTLAVTSAEGITLADCSEATKDRSFEVDPFDGLLGEIAFASQNRLVVNRWALTPNGDRLEIWDAFNGTVLSLVPMSARVSGLAVHGAIALAGLADGTVAVVDLAQAEVLVTIIDAGPDAWLCVTPDGLFDGTAAAMRWVGWRSDAAGQIVPLETFFIDFYRPGVLAEIMRGDRPKATVDVATLLQVPGLRTLLARKQAHLEDRDGAVTVCFAEEPGVAAGISPGDRRVYLPSMNGYRVDRQDPTCRFQRTLTGVESTAAGFMAQLAESSPGAARTPWDGQQSDTRDATLHVLTVGVTEYPAASGAARLPYAVPSAQAVEAAFRMQRTADAYSAVRVWEGLYDAAATRQQIQERLRAMSAAVKPQDVVVMYLAGHGKVALGEEMFYFVPVDGREAALRDTAVNTAMLAEALRNLQARRAVLLLDACQAGGAIEALDKIAAIKARAEAQRSSASRSDGVGIYVVAATLPLSYAVGLGDQRSALAITLLEALNAGGEIQTALGVVAYVERHLPDVSERATRFRQVPLVSAVGLDFPLRVR